MSIDNKKQESPKAPQKSDAKSNAGRVNTGSSDSTIPERATDKHTESSPAPKK